MFPLTVTMFPDLRKLILFAEYGTFHFWITESYAAPMISRSQARCRLFNTDRSGRR